MTSGPPAREPATEQRIRAVVAAHLGRRGALLPILHALVEEFGYVEAAAVPVVADALNLSIAEVHGVVTFYRDFRTTPPGRVTVRICHAEACQAVGADALVEHARALLGVAPGATTPDGGVTLDEVFCLGNCALGPSVQVGGTLHGRVDAGRFTALVAGATA